MKKTLVLLIFAFLGTNLNAQDDYISAEKEKEIMSKVNKMAVEFKKTLKDESEMWQTFKMDTFLIERYIDLRMEEDYSTHGMNFTIYEAEKRYDRLLNKYYKILLNKLEGDDKKVLIDTQKAWIAFKDKEIKLINLLYSDKYTGGGTMYSNIRVGATFEITKKRAIELALFINE